MFCFYVMCHDWCFLNPINIFCLFQVFNNKKVPLADLIERLRKYVKDLGIHLEMARPIVEESVKHAENLTVLSDRLKGELKDTKVFADTPLRAAYVYSVIVDAIYEALKAAKMANDTAHEAKKKVSVLKNKTLLSNISSHDGWMDGCTDGWIYEWISRQRHETDRQIDRQRQTDIQRQTDRQTDSQIYRDRQKDGDRQQGEDK